MTELMGVAAPFSPPKTYLSICPGGLEVGGSGDRVAAPAHLGILNAVV